MPRIDKDPRFRLNWKGALCAALGVVVVACSGAPTPETVITITPESTQPSEKPTVPAVPPKTEAAANTPEISMEEYNRLQNEGFVPGYYSELVKKYHLEARVFKDNEGIMARMEASRTYLNQFYYTLIEARKTDPECDPLLSDYHINTPDNYPIDIPQNWHLSDFILSFLKENGNGTIPFDTGNAKDWHTNQSMLLYSEFQFENEQWVLHSSIIGTEFMKPSTITFHELNGFGYTITDADVAFVLLHEYGHKLQSQKIIKEINHDAVKLKEIGSDKSLFEKEFVKRIDTHTDNLVQQTHVEGIDFCEVQCDAIENLPLWSLNRINGNEFFPGTRWYDILNQQDFDFYRKLYPDIKIQNQYRLFLDTVIPTKNAFNMDWLLTAREIY